MKYKQKDWTDVLLNGQHVLEYLRRIASRAKHPRNKTSLQPTGDNKVGIAHLMTFLLSYFDRDRCHQPQQIYCVNLININYTHESGLKKSLILRHEICYEYDNSINY